MKKHNKIKTLDVMGTVFFKVPPALEVKDLAGKIRGAIRVEVEPRTRMGLVSLAALILANSGQARGRILHLPRKEQPNPQSAMGKFELYLIDQNGNSHSLTELAWERARERQARKATEQGDTPTDTGTQT
jgi:hypothetical protein